MSKHFIQQRVSLRKDEDGQVHLLLMQVNPARVLQLAKDTHG